MRRNENGVTVAVVRERERESRRVKKNCSHFDEQKFTKNIYGRMDYERSLDKNVSAFSKNSLSFLCAARNRDIMAESGITLLALIITVVIMIILATVTINVTLGDGGLVDQAKHAAEATLNSTQTEQKQMDNLASQLNDIIAGIGGTGGTGGVTNSTPGGETNTVPGEDTNTIPGGETNSVDTNTIEPEPEPEPLPDGTISIGEPQWQEDGTATVTVSTTEPGVTIEYQIGGTDGSWTPVEGGAITGIENGETVYVRITDGEQSSNPQEITVADTTAPEKANIEVNPTSVLVGENLTATVTHVDNETGVDIENSKWVLTQSADEIGTGEDFVSQYTGAFDANPDTIDIDTSTAGTFYLHVLTTDVAGNKTETVSEAITINAITGTVTQNGQVSWSAGQATLVLQSSETAGGQYKIVYKINDAGSWQTYNGTSITGLSHGDKVTAYLTNASQTTYGPEATFEIKDETNPTVTVTAQGSPSTNSITVTAQVSDNESGMKAEPTYTFQIKQSTAGSYTTPSGASNISNATYTFTGLTQGTTYDIQVIVNGDNAGNSGTGTTQATTNTVPGASEGLETGTITASPVTWSGGKASTTLTANVTGFQIQYQVNGVNEGSWSSPANSPVTVSNLDHEDTVYARLTDGTNAGDYAAINIIDGIDPTVNVTVGTITETSIAVSVSASDGQSGLATSGTYKYYLNNDLKQTTTNTDYTYTGLTGGTEYTIKVEAVDKAGRTGSDTTQATTEKPKSEIEIARDEGTSFGTTTDLKDDLDNTVVIPGGFGIAEDSGTKVEEGIVIEDGDGNQFVWIPTGEYNVSTTINSSGKLTNNLSRRTFTTSGATEKSGDSVIPDYYYGEGDSRSVAKNQIGAFKASAESVVNGGKGGFYIGRYELGTGNVIKAGVVPSTSITRDKAKSNIENMYAGNSNVESELISSYAWDTALNFICQTNVGSGKGYNLAMTTSSQYGNIGTNKKENTGAYAADKYSNIHDLLGNCYEWTTEYCSISNARCVHRGGRYDFSGYYAAVRHFDDISDSRNYVSARAQLYVK